MTIRQSLTVRDMVFAAAGAALMTICAWISIPLPSMVPFTLQTFGVCLTAALLGPRTGLWSLLGYILLGAAGAPVFADFRGGMGVLLGPTGGYVAGFLFTALTTGLASERWGDRIGRMAVAMALGVALCYAFGTAWFMAVYARRGGSIGLAAALGMCVVPYLVPDGLKILLAAVLAKRLRPAVRRGWRE